MANRRKPTSTSSFGVSRREGHDSSDFYARFPLPEVTNDGEVGSRKDIDEIFVGDAGSMPEIDDNSVALVVTSPPYFAGKEYERALGEGHIPATYVEYLATLEAVFAECVRKLEPGGRIAVNVANLGRRPFRSLSADIVDILQNRLRLLMRGEVIWQKQRGAAGSCAWGSFQRPANPVLRDLTERVVIASKGRFSRILSAKERYERGLPSESSLSRDEFLEATTDIWEIPPESASRVGHPAPFPVELPVRLIHLYTYRGDLVLDPFMGSGTTAVAALRTDRHFVGYDTERDYVDAARDRVKLEAEARALDGRARDVVLAAEAAEDENGDDFRDRGVRSGVAAKDLAAELVSEAGFSKLRREVRVVEGVEVSLEADDGTGRRWLFDVCGGFTSSRPGLRRNEVLWRALGKAAVIREAAPDASLVLLTTDLPPSGGVGHAALEVVSGPGRPVRDVIELTSPEGFARLVGYAAAGPGAEASGGRPAVARGKQARSQPKE